MPEDLEIPLSGGNVGRPVRMGDTVRRPAGPWSSSVHSFLAHLNFDGAPRTLGFDDHGRHVVEYVEGSVDPAFAARDKPAAVRRIGRLLRDFHDAAAGYDAPEGARWQVAIPPDAEEMIVHHDAAPRNLVMGPERWVLIDWDGAGPGSRTWDLAYACRGFIPLSAATPAVEGASLLADLAAGYGLDEEGRHLLADTLERRTVSMYELLANGHRTGQQPWAGLWTAGHGSAWRNDASYIHRHRAALTAALVDASRTSLPSKTYASPGSPPC